MNSIFLQKCHFGTLMQNSPFKFQAYECDGTNFTLNDCTGKIKEPYEDQYHEERNVILLRAGMDPSDGVAMYFPICSTHRSILGKGFIE